MFRRILPLGLIVTLVVIAFPLAAYFDELSSIKAELVAWQTKHDAADFSDLYHTLDQLAAPTFDDISQDAWYATYVNSVASLGIMSGYKDADGESTGQFGPGNNVTIGEILKMAFKVAKIDEKQCGTAGAGAHWAQRFASCGEKMAFRLFYNPPVDLNRPATRAEVLAILFDASGTKAATGMAPFSDTVTHPYANDIAAATERGVVAGDKDINGAPTGTFRPDAPVLRAEAAKIIYQWLEWQSQSGEPAVS